MLLQSIVSCRLACIVLFGGKTALDLCGGIHSGVDTVMGILAHLVAHHNNGYQYGNTCSTACCVGSDTQNISVCQSLYIHIAGNHDVIGTDACLNGREGNIGECNDTDTCTAANGDTCHNSIGIKCIAAADHQILCGINFHIVAGEGSCGELGYDDVQSSGNTGCTTTGNSCCISSNHFPGGSQNLNSTGNLFVCTADHLMGICSTADHISQSFVFKIGYNGHSRNCRTAGTGCTCGNVVKICVGISMNSHALCLMNGTDGCFNAAVEYQDINVACNSGTAAGTKADCQEEYIVITVGQNRNIRCSFCIVRIHLGTDSLVIDQCDNGCTDTGRTADRKSTGRVY